MKREIFDWSIGEVGWHATHGRCIVKDIKEGAIAGWLDPVLIVIRERDGEIEWFNHSNIDTLTLIDKQNSNDCKEVIDASSSI